MPKFDPNKVSYEKLDRMFVDFCDTVCKLKGRGSVFNFLKDLFNRQERIMFIRRLMIARMLLEDETYQSIQHKLKVGSSTISRVDRALNFGRGGYVKALKHWNVKYPYS